MSETEELGGATLEQLQAQRQQIEDIHKQVISLEGALKRSDALIRNFAKRLSTDAAIQAFLCLNCLLLVGIITFSIYREGGLDSGDDTKEGVPDDDDARSAVSDFLI